MSEQDNTATTVLVVAIIGIVTCLMLCACYAYNRYWTRRARKNRVLDDDLYFDAMASCFCCCGECLKRVGTGASDAAVGAVNVARDGTRTAVTESTSFWWFMCDWLGWLLRYVFCCCCYSPRDDVPASEANTGLPVDVAVAVPILVERANGPEAEKGDGSQTAVARAVSVNPPAVKPQSDEGQSSSEPASVTTPLLALAV